MFIDREGSTKSGHLSPPAARGQGAGHISPLYEPLPDMGEEAGGHYIK